jgi:hypothetical protein
MAIDDMQIAAEYAAFRRQMKVTEVKILLVHALASHWTMRKFTMRTLKTLGYPQLKRCEPLPSELAIREQIEKKFRANGYYKRHKVQIQVSVCVLSAPFQNLPRGTIFASVAWPGPAKLKPRYWSKPVQCHRIRHEVRVQTKEILGILVRQHPSPQVIVLLPCHWVGPGRQLKIRPYLFAGYDGRDARKVASAKTSAHVALRFASCLRIYHYWTKNRKIISHPQLGSGFTDYVTVTKIERHSLWHGFEGLFETHLRPSQSKFWLSAYLVATRTGLRENFYAGLKEIAKSIGTKSGHF